MYNFREWADETLEDFRKTPCVVAAGSRAVGVPKLWFPVFPLSAMAKKFEKCWKCSGFAVKKSRMWFGVRESPDLTVRVGAGVVSSILVDSSSAILRRTHNKNK